MSPSLILFVVALTILNCDANSGGAGRCPSNRPAVGGPHLEKTTHITGSLDIGFVTVTIDDQPMDSTSVTVLELDSVTNHRLCVQRPDIGYKGILIRWGNAETEDLFEIFDEENYALAVYCPQKNNVVGLTHRNPNYKSETCVELAPFTVQAVNMPVDVTVMVRNTQGVSEYYYSRFYVNAGAPASSGFLNRLLCRTIPVVCF